MMLQDEIRITLCGFSQHREFDHEFHETSNSYIFRLQVAGTSEAELNGTSISLQPGHLLLVRPGDRYRLRVHADGTSAAGSSDFYVFCQGPWIDRWWGQGDRPRKSRIADMSRIETIWNQLVLEHRRLEGGSSDISRLLLQTLCKMLDRAVAETPVRVSPSTIGAARMKQYIEEHATLPIRLEDVAAHAGLSVSRSVHLFKAHYGLSIIQYVNRVRLSIALEWMNNSSIPLEQIAETSGFGSYTYFRRVFHAHYGMPPGAYRKQR